MFMSLPLFCCSYSPLPMAMLFTKQRRVHITYLASTLLWWQLGLYQELKCKRRWQGLDRGLKELVLKFWLLKVKNGWGQTGIDWNGNVQAEVDWASIRNALESTGDGRPAVDKCVSFRIIAMILQQEQRAEGKQVLFPSFSSLSPITSSSSPFHSPLDPQPWSWGKITWKKNLGRKTLELNTSIDRHQKASKLQSGSVFVQGGGSRLQF